MVMPILCGGTGMTIAYTLWATGPWSLYNKPSLERMAIAVTILGVIAGLTRALASRDRFHSLLAVVAVIVLLREIHWEWTTKFVYIALAAVTVVGLIWRDKVIGYLHRHPMVRVWFTSTVLTYVLSQAIARRAFRGIMPNEEPVYSDMEELVEVVSHLMLVITILVGPWFPKAKTPAPTPASETPSAQTA